MSLRRSFFDREHPSDLIVVIAVRQAPIVIDERRWQIEKFVANYSSLMVDGKIPEEIYDAITGALEGGGGEQKNPIESVKEAVDFAQGVTPKLKTVVDDLKSIFGFGGDKKS